MLALAALRLARRAIADQAARAAKADPPYPRSRPRVRSPRRAGRRARSWTGGSPPRTCAAPARPGRRAASGWAGTPRRGFGPPLAAGATPAAGLPRPHPADHRLGVATFVQILGVDGLNLLDLAHTAVFSVLLLGSPSPSGRSRRGRPCSACASCTVGAVTSAPDPAGLPAEPPRTAPSCRSTARTRTASSPGCGRCGRDAGAAQGKRCDLFVLSDTTNPDVRLAELDAWQRARRRCRAASTSSTGGACECETQDSNTQPNQ